MHMYAYILGPIFNYKSVQFFHKLQNNLYFVLPGYGKSLVFQILPFLHPEQSAVIISSALNAIICEQALKLGERAINISEELVAALECEKKANLRVKV